MAGLSIIITGFREAPGLLSYRCPLLTTHSERLDKPNPLKSSGGLRRGRGRLRLWARRDFITKQKFACCCLIHRTTYHVATLACPHLAAALLIPTTSALRI